MTTELVRFRKKPSKKQQLKDKLALWAWYLGLKQFKD